MKKNLFLNILFFLLFCSTLIFAGGKKEKDSDIITLKLFHQLDKSDDVLANNFQELVVAFEEQHPDIKLDIDYLANESYHNKLQTMTVADELPDVLFLWPGKRTGQVTGSGKIKDISSWIAPHKDEFFPAAMVAQGPNGEIWELPEQITATHVMYTNMKLLKTLGLGYPKTFQDLLAQGPIIRKAGYIPIAMDNKDGWQVQSCLLSVLVERTGGRAWLEKAIKGEASFTDTEFVSALEVIDTLSKKEMFSPGINSAEYGRALTDFVNGNAVYLIDGAWRLSSLIGELNESMYDSITFNVFPTLKNEKGQPDSTSIVAGTGFGMNAKLEGKKAEAAWKWIWFFSGPDGGKIKQKQGWFPAYKLPTPDTLNVLSVRLSDFLEKIPGGYVIDAVLDGEGMGILHPAIQEMMLGKISANEVAQKYETWVASNESGRKK